MATGLAFTRGRQCSQRRIISNTSLSLNTGRMVRWCCHRGLNWSQRRATRGMASPLGGRRHLTPYSWPRGRAQGGKTLCYGEALAKVQSVAAGLIDHGIKPGDKIIILSGPSITHGILKLAAQYIGVATVPVAEQYSLIPDALPRLVDIAEKTQPAMVFTEDADKFARGIGLPQFDNVVKVACAGVADDMVAWSSLLAGRADVSAARDAVTPETLAKILFTSGSTSTPKGCRRRIICCASTRTSTAAACHS